MKRVTARNEIPKGKHWFILTFSSINIPGDERSRTNPGHGYPEHTEEITEYTAFTNKDEWTKEITKLEKDEEEYFAAEANPATVTSTTTVTIS